MRVVLCNHPREGAQELAIKLVNEQLAACVNLLPVSSVYRWEGTVHVDPETTLVIKVAAAGVDALRERLAALHPYDVPEVVVLQVDADASLPAYVAWVRGGGG
jgi:periplasmic divalent cation tolerance protein